MTAIKNRYDFVFLFDVKDGNPNGDPDFDNMPRTDEETNHGLVTDVCIKRKIRNYVQSLNSLDLLKDHVSPCDIFIREGNVLNPLIEEKRGDADKKEEDEKKAVKLGRYEMCKQYFDIRTFGAVMSTGDDIKAVDDSENEEEGGNGKKSKKKDTKKKIKGLGVVRGPVQLTFARTIDPVDAKSHSLTRCCVTKESDAEDKNNTFGNKNTVSYGLYRMHGFISATDAAKTGFSEEDKDLLFKAMINAFENDRAAARGEMTSRALIVFKHKSPLGNARAGQLFDLIQINKKEGVEFPRSFGDYNVTSREEIEAALTKSFPDVTVEEIM